MRQYWRYLFLSYSFSSRSFRRQYRSNIQSRNQEQPSTRLILVLDKLADRPINGWLHMGYLLSDNFTDCLCQELIENPTSYTTFLCIKLGWDYSRSYPLTNRACTCSEIKYRVLHAFIHPASFLQFLFLLFLKHDYSWLVYQVWLDLGVFFVRFGWTRYFNVSVLYFFRWYDHWLSKPLLWQAPLRDCSGGFAGHGIFLSWITHQIGID